MPLPPPAHRLCRNPAYLAFLLLGCQSPETDELGDGDVGSMDTTDTTDTTGDYEDICQGDEGDGGDNLGCVSPIIEELELPGLEDIRMVRFADLDGDGNDELLGLSSSYESLITVLDDGVIETPLTCTILEPGFIGNFY